MYTDKVLQMFLILYLSEEMLCSRGCFRMRGWTTCGKKEYVDAKLELFDDDDYNDQKMEPGFGFGKTYGSTKIIRNGDGIWMEGCAWDFLTTPDPYLKVTNYNCNGKTNTLILKVDKSKCRYSYAEIKHDNTPINHSIHQYFCWGIRVNLDTQTIEQQIR